MNTKNKLMAALVLAVFVLPGISFAQTMSPAQLQQEIQSLTAELQSLETQLVAQGGSAPWCYTFNTNLTIGMSGSAVSALQTAIEKDGESVQVTGSYDDQTASAVTAFQEKYASDVLAPYGLSYGTGAARGMTREKLNKLFGCGSTSGNPIANPITVSISSSTASSTTFVPPIHICPAWVCNGPKPIVLPVTVSTPTTTVQNVIVTPTSLSFTVAQNGAANQTLTVAAPSGIAWSVSTNPPPNTPTSWLGTAYAFNCGNTACGNGSVGVTVYDGLAVGTYNGSITISENFSGSKEIIPVTLNVTATGATTSTTVTSLPTTAAQPLTVQVDTSTPAAGEIQTGSTGNSLLIFDMTNPNSDPVRVTALHANTGYYVSSTVTLAGETSSGGVEQYNNVTLYDITSGNRVLIGTFPAFSLSTSSLIGFGFNSVIYPSNLIIPAQSTGKYLITGDVASYRVDPAIVGADTGTTIVGSSIVTPAGVTESVAGTTAIDQNANAIVGVSGYAEGSPMNIVQGQ